MAERVLAHVSINIVRTRQSALGQRKLTRDRAEFISSQLYLLNLLEIHILQRDLDEGVGQQTGIIIFIYKFENPLEIDGLGRTI